MTIGETEFLYDNMNSNEESIFDDSIIIYENCNNQHQNVSMQSSKCLQIRMIDFMKKFKIIKNILYL